MFRIIADQAEEDCVELEQCVSLLMAENVKIEEVVRELSTLSGMEEVLLHLYGMHDRMQEEALILRQMMQGLYRTIQCYRNCENRICGNVEQSTVRHVHREVSMNDLSRISDLMKKIF